MIRLDSGSVKANGPGVLRSFREDLRMTESWRAAKLSTVFLLWLCTAVLIISSMCEPARATTTSYAVRVYTFAPKAELSTFVDWDTSSPVATDGHGDVAFVIDVYLDQFSAVVWSADGTVRTIASPRVDMDKAFRIYNIEPDGKRGYEGARIDSLVFFRAGGHEHDGVRRRLWRYREGGLDPAFGLMVVAGLT